MGIGTRNCYGQQRCVCDIKSNRHRVAAFGPNILCNRFRDIEAKIAYGRPRPVPPPVMNAVP